MKRMYFIILSFLIGVLFLGVIYFFAIPTFLNSNFLLNKINNILYKETGFELTVSGNNVKTLILPLRVQVSADKILLQNKQFNELIKIDTLKSDIKLVPLLQGKIYLVNSYVDNAEAIINKDYSYLFNAPKIIKNFKHINLKNFTLKSAKADISGQGLISNSTITIGRTKIDKFNPQKKIKLSTNIDISGQNNISNMKFDIDLRLPVNYKNIEKSFIKADIKNFKPEIFSGTINFLYNDISNISGIINANITKQNEKFADLEITSKDFKINFNDDKPPIFHSKPIEVKSRLLLENNLLNVTSAKIISDSIKVSATGKFDVFNTKNMNNDISLSIDKSDISEFISLLPPLKDAIEEIDLQTLKENVVVGNILGHLNIKGNLLTPDIFGNILVSNCYVVKPILNAKRATIKLLFNGDKMSLDVNVPTHFKEFVSAKGIFELYGDKRCNLKVKSTDNVDLETAQTVLNPLQDVIKLYFGPVPVMKIKGIGNIDITVTGNRQEPNIVGDFKFRDSTASFIDLPNIIVKNMTGKLLFNDTETFFETKSASLNSTPVEIKGNCDLYGKFDFNAISKSQNLTPLFGEIKGSPMLGDINLYLEKLNNIKGIGDINLHIYGNLKNIHDMELDKNVFVDTNIDLYSVSADIADMPIKVSNVFGKLSMEKNNLLLDLYALINKSKIYINGKIKDNNANLAINAKNFRIIDLTILLPQNFQRPLLTLIKSDNFINSLPYIYTDFNTKYTGNIDKINYNNINLKGKLYSVKNSFKDVFYSLARSNFKSDTLDLNTGDINLKVGGILSNVFSKKPIVSGVLKIDNFDFGNINLDALKEFDVLKPYIQNLEKMSGFISINSYISNNTLNAESNIRDVKLDINKKTHEILNGKINVKNNVLYADNINARIFEMPILVSGKTSFSNNKIGKYDFYIKTKPNQDFIDEIFNKKALYPIKIKGNLTLDTTISGNQNKSDLKSNLFLDNDATIYYLGATIGDKVDAVKINSDISLFPNEIRINEMNYNKVVSSLNENETVIPLLTINGAINSLKNNTLKFNNLKIKSILPVDAKIFNIIFRKPFVKEGVFTSDLILNGTSIKPQVIGKLDITSVELPFFESNINRINMDFSPRYININSKGDLVTNEISLNARLKNDFTLPYIVENVDIHLRELDLNQILNKLKNIEENNFKIHNTPLSVQSVDYGNFVINNSTLTADRVVMDKIVAQNFTSNVVMGQDKILNVKNFSFNMADGSVNGNITHDYDKNILNIIMNLNQADIANIAETLFNLKGQIYGQANGRINLSCKPENDSICLSTLAGNGYFEIQNGRMPKLGSLEYLLKAGNLINNGITGLTINGIIDLLSPLKSGEFKNIKGDFKITDGIADDINIYSNGKDLNMYITGNYNLSNSMADFKIFGSLSKEVTTLLNKVKNLSLNTLLKTIPIAKREKENEFTEEISKIPTPNGKDNIYKFFRVLINGDINENGFVKSFEWID